MKYIFMVVFIVSTPFFGFAECNKESRDLDSCLQCCTDTSQIVQRAKQYPNFISDVSAACSTRTTADTVSLASKEAKNLYVKYKIDSSVINSLCANIGSTQEGTYQAETYSYCILTCKNKFSRKTKRK